jgi:hypothetical protein
MTDTAKYDHSSVLYIVVKVCVYVCRQKACAVATSQVAALPVHAAAALLVPTTVAIYTAPCSVVTVPDLDDVCVILVRLCHERLPLW